MFLKWCQNLQNLNKTKYYLKAGLNENRGENKPVSILFTLIYDLFLSDVYINMSSQWEKRVHLRRFDTITVHTVMRTFLIIEISSHSHI